MYACMHACMYVCIITNTIPLASLLYLQHTIFQPLAYTKSSSPTFYYVGTSDVFRGRASEVLGGSIPKGFGDQSILLGSGFRV